MLELALKARMPIIRAKTTDLMNLREVIEFYAGPNVKVAPYKAGFPAGCQVYYAVDEYEPTQHTYDAMVENEKSLILINQGEDSIFAFDVGEIPIPRQLMVKALKPIVNAKHVDAVVDACRGLTLKSMAEVVRITGAAYGDIIPSHVRLVRAMMTGTQVGLDPVDTSLDVYLAPEGLSEWLEINTPYFNSEKVDNRLVPRGILFSGPPGVGKTQGAKYIARNFGVHLYRLDMASALGRYVGQSEANLSRVLSTIDREEPCVLLLDEVEKVFAESDDTGVTARLLSQILWWLQEHRSKVFTVMTTNDLEKLPPELYRPGRVDRVMGISPLDLENAVSLGMSVYNSFSELAVGSGAFKTLLTKALKSGMKGNSFIPHAQVVECVYTIIKREGWLL